jgi:ribonuclease P protein component
VSDSKYEKNSRLLSANDFSNLKIASSVFKKQSLIIYYKKNILGHSRLGLSVSKKVGNSPIRNRFKRILREFYRNSKIRDINLDILIVVSFTKSFANELQDNKETLLLSNTNEFFNFLINLQ